MYTLESVSSVANFIKPGLPLSVCNVFFVSKGNIHVLNFILNSSFALCPTLSKRARIGRISVRIIQLARGSITCGMVV